MESTQRKVLERITLITKIKGKEKLVSKLMILTTPQHV